MPDLTHQIHRPDRVTTCVIFASPHSGRDYPRGFLRQSQLDRKIIRSSEDAWVDRLFGTAPEHGAPLLVETAPRAYVDLNRSAEELDPAVVEGARKPGHNPRVASGLGVIPRVVAGGRPIYRGKISMIEAQRRLNQVWYPYHDTLWGLMRDAQAQFGRSILIDCHSMPREALEGAARGRKRPDIVLGDRFGASAGLEIVDAIESVFASEGFEVARNTPFAGAYVTQTYGRPSRHQHAIQVEIDRSLYMNEATLQPLDGFDALRARLGRVMSKIADLGRASGRLAAE
ncbi:MAG: N-formylglutamate amidohydrolase [Rhodobacteraceae bacterium]|nr:N-formylglutamate amidohydrolase [Paracoccaceae bacterium]